MEDLIVIETSVSGDLNFEFYTPFEDNNEGTKWTLDLIPEANAGGQQMFSTAIFDYFAMDITLDLWPGAFQFAATHFEWSPPFFSDLCWSADWGTDLFELWVDLNLSLWECDAGLFDWILNGNTHNCGLTNYKFNNHIFELKWDAFNMGGDLLAQRCFGVEEAPVEETTDNTNEEEPVTPEEPATGLIADEWF